MTVNEDFDSINLDDDEDFEYDPLLDLDDDDFEEDMDSPRECAFCTHVFDAAVYFVRHPYRVYCPDCGETQPKEYDYDYYIEY